MGIQSENAYEGRIAPGHPGRVFFLLELNHECPYTPVCGSSCILIMRDVPGGNWMTVEETRQAGYEAIRNGKYIRNFSAPGMEPFASEELLLDLLGLYHSLPVYERPGSFGAITSGVNAQQLLPSLVRTPLSWVIFSADAPETGLRNSLRTFDPSFQAMLHLWKQGGIEELTATTIFTGANERGVFEIGKRIEAEGLVQWFVGRFGQPDGDRLRWTTSGSEMVALAHRLAKQFGKSSTTVFVDVGYEALRDYAGGEAAIEHLLDHWRVEYPLPGAENVHLMSWSPRARFARVRHDGQILARTDLEIRRLRSGAFGRYRPGAIAELLQRLNEPAACSPSLVSLAS